MKVNFSKTGRILVVDDNEDLLKATKIFLKRYFSQIDLESNPKNIPTIINKNFYDVILLDMNFTLDVSSGKEGFFWLEKIIEIQPSSIVILITAYGNIKTAIKAIKLGASDFVLKPWDNEKLLQTILDSLNKKNAYNNKAGEKSYLKNNIKTKFPEIIGESYAMMEVFEIVDKVAATDASILLFGENGTGKGLFAHAIHRNSNRKDFPMVDLDLGSLNEDLFESELFGYKNGAFTGAFTDREGRFEAANKGTLFLDEIGNLSIQLQTKLLKSLQKRTINRIGENMERQIDIRLICATNMPIYDMLENNTFRQDLLYRINTIEIEIPPLRKRIEDIPLLADYFIQKNNKRFNKKILKISDSAMVRLQKHKWPGNIRELQHSLERAVIMSNSGVLLPEDFTFSIHKRTKEKGFDNIGRLNLKDMEKALIQQALRDSSGSISRAATILGITRSSLYRRLEKYDL